MKYFKNHFSNWEWRFDGKWPDTSYYGPLYATTNIAIETFSNLGFTDIDFTPIKLLNDESINLKWNKDTKNSFYCKFRIENGGRFWDSYFYPSYSNGSTGTNFMPFYAWGSEGYRNVPDPTLIFLPLFNNGFFMNGRNHNNSTQRGEPQYNNINTLFNFKDGGYARDQSHSEDGYDGFDLICLPSNKDKDLFYYLYGCAGTSFFGFLNPNYYPTIYIDLGNKKVKTLIRRINYQDTYTDFILPNDYYINYTNYTNQNDNNVCTLCNIYTKDEKEKINNLYYVIDKPEQVNIRDMFTVNGRTFFYFCPPFAIELPNN